MVPEEIIVDANTLFSFFKSDSTRRQVFRELLKRGCEFFSTDKLFDELKSNKSNIIKFAHIDESDFSYLYRLLHNEIICITNFYLKRKLSHRMQKTSHISHLHCR